MAVLQINPAVREEIVTVGNGGKVQLDEGAFAENFVEFNHLTCYNDILYDRTGKAISSAECKHDIYEVLRGLGFTSNMTGRIKNLWEVSKTQAYVDHISNPENKISVQNGTITVDLKTGELSFDETMIFSPHRLDCNFGPSVKVKTPTLFLECVNKLIHEYDRE